VPKNRAGSPEAAEGASFAPTGFTLLRISHEMPLHTPSATPDLAELIEPSLSISEEEGGRGEGEEEAIEIPFGPLGRFRWRFRWTRARVNSYTRRVLAPRRRPSDDRKCIIGDSQRTRLEMESRYRRDTTRRWIETTFRKVSFDGTSRRRSPSRQASLIFQEYSGARSLSLSRSLVRSI